MAIRKRLSRGIVLTGVTTATVIGVSVGIAAAVAITFSITPGGNITAKAGTTILKDTKTGSKVTCASSNSKATLLKGHGISASKLGSVTALSFSNPCTGPLNLPTTVTNTGFPWKLSATSYNSTTGTTTGFISGIKASLSAPGCTATVGGATATSTGKVKITYTNSTGKLKVLATGGNLHVWNVSGCPSAILASGDPTVFSGTYTVTPKQTITSP